eukprot:5223427-Prymnesium_polylepis.1
MPEPTVHRAGRWAGGQLPRGTHQAERPGPIRAPLEPRAPRHGVELHCIGRSQLRARIQQALLHTEGRDAAPHQRLARERRQLLRLHDTRSCEGGRIATEVERIEPLRHRGGVPRKARCDRRAAHGAWV